MAFDDMMVTVLGFADDCSLRLTQVIDDRHRHFRSDFVTRGLVDESEELL